MARSYASTVLAASPDEVWAHIRDFNGLATWHGGLVVQSEIKLGVVSLEAEGEPNLFLTTESPNRFRP